MRFFMGLFCVVGIPIFIWIVVVPFELFFFENIIQTSPKVGTTQTQWLNNFLTNCSVLLFFSSIVTFLWQLYGQYAVFLPLPKIEWNREFWFCLLGIIATLNLIFGYSLNEETQDVSRLIASFFYLLHGIIIFLVTTILFSPHNVRFAPLGSQNLAYLLRGKY